MTTKHFIFILVALCTATAGRAQQFDQHFDGRNLRLDYIMAGDKRQQAIYFQHAYTTPQWAGRRARMAEVLLRGNGQLVMSDHKTHERLYVHTFSTLFQEWLATEEATRVSRAFEASYNVPMPRRKVDIELTLTDFHNRTVASMRHTLDPTDCLIRPLGTNGIPHHYIWKGRTLDKPEAKADGQERRDFHPSGADPTGQPDIVRCVDLAIVAEGYTEGQMGKFYTDCQRVADALFAHEPFTSLRTCFNIVAVAAPSLGSGPSVPHLGHWCQTPCRTHYDTFYTERYLMSQDMHRIYDLLSGVPFEHIIVLVNSDTYGGGGIYNQLNVTTSDHPTFRQVLVHEFGHGYAGLGDEYFYDDGYENMYPADTEPWEPNLTTLVDFDAKWADLLPKGTPVPTPPTRIPDYRTAHTDKDLRLLNEATQRVGVYEGGGYQSRGVYRPAQECRMKVNEGELFCPVCSRAIRRITEFCTASQE